MFGEGVVKGPGLVGLLDKGCFHSGGALVCTSETTMLWSVRAEGWDSVRFVAGGGRVLAS